MSKVEVGDLVRMKDHSNLSIGSFYRFRMVGKEIRFIESRDLVGKVGIVVFDVKSREENHMYADGVYHVAFGDTVIRAFHDYFEKV